MELIRLPLKRLKAPNHLIVQEDEIHLDENESHPSGRRQSQHDIVAFCVSFQLKVLAKFQTTVNHAADAKCCKENQFS